MTPVPVFLTLTVAPGTGPPCSSVTRPESVAPETWARLGVAEKSAKARASDRQIHSANEELQPLLNIIIPPGALPCGSTRSRCGERLRAEALHKRRTGRLGVARMCAESQRSAIHDESNRKHFYIHGLMHEKAGVSR